jgi:hypothetical protein
LRSSLTGLSTPELIARREELGPPSVSEIRDQEAARFLQEQIASEVEFLGNLQGQHERLSSLPRRQRRPESERIERAEIQTRESLARKEAELHELAGVDHRARAELAVVEHLIAERERLALAAIRISPPSYIAAELGERPGTPARRAAWDRAAQGVECYRRRYGVRDTDSALGVRPEELGQRADWQSQQRELRRSQRELGRAQEVELSRGSGSSCDRPCVRPTRGRPELGSGSAPRAGLSRQAPGPVFPGVDAAQRDFLPRHHRRSCGKEPHARAPQSRLLIGIDVEGTSFSGAASRIGRSSRVEVFARDRKEGHAGFKGRQLAISLGIPNSALAV